MTDAPDFKERAAAFLLHQDDGCVVPFSDLMPFAANDALRIAELLAKVWQEGRAQGVKDATPHIDPGAANERDHAF